MSVVPAQSEQDLQCPAVAFTTQLSATEAPESPCLDSLMGGSRPLEGRKEEEEGREAEEEAPINFIFFYVSPGSGPVPREQEKVEVAGRSLCSYF